MCETLLTVSTPITRPGTCGRTHRAGFRRRRWGWLVVWHTTPGWVEGDGVDDVARTDIDFGKCARNIHREPVQDGDGGGQDRAKNIVSGGGVMARTANVWCKLLLLPLSINFLQRFFGNIADGHHAYHERVVGHTRCRVLPQETTLIFHRCCGKPMWKSRVHSFMERSDIMERQKGFLTTGHAVVNKSAFCIS